MNYTNNQFALDLASINSSDKINIKSILSSTITIKEYTINLSLNEVKYILDLLHSEQELLGVIGNSIDSIISDGVINLYDLPIIIMLFAQIFKAHCMRNIIKDVDILKVIRFSMDSIIDYQYLPLPNVDREVIKNIIDNALSLLSTNIELNKKINKGFYRYFCCME